MRAEQEYLRDKQRRHNRLLHGWGVVCGLEVVVDTDKNAGPLAVKICSGYALGPYGDEICVPEAVPLDLAYCAQPSPMPCDPKYPVPQPVGTSPLLVMIRYAECPTRPMRTLPAGCGCDETACEYSRIRDGYEVQCMQVSETKLKEILAASGEITSVEKGKLPKCPPCPSDPWLLLASIRPVSSTTGEGLVLGASSIQYDVRRIVHSLAI
jgi:hypothetical protein